MNEQEDFDAWGARADRFDGFDRGDLDNDYAEEQQAKDEYEDSVMRKVIEIEVRNVYGNDLIYPANDAARALARIAGKKTLSADNIKDACALGLEVVEIHKNYGPIAALLNN